MWTKENRGRYDRSRLRYPSDLTDEEWALVEPLIAPAKRGGNKRTVDVREVVNGLMYVLCTGCQWRAIPKDLPPRSTVHDYFDLWAGDGTLDRIHHALYVQCRELAISRSVRLIVMFQDPPADPCKMDGELSPPRISLDTRSRPIAPAQTKPPDGLSRS